MGGGGREAAGVGSRGWKVPEGGRITKQKQQERERERGRSGMEERGREWKE